MYKINNVHDESLKSLMTFYPYKGKIFLKKWKKILIIKKCFSDQRGVVNEKGYWNYII